MQHLALARDGHHLRGAEAARAAASQFMPTPGTLLRRAARSGSRSCGIEQIDEDIAVLRELEILVDGDERHATCCRSS